MAHVSCRQRLAFHACSARFRIAALQPLGVGRRSEKNVTRPRATPENDDLQELLKADIERFKQIEQPRGGAYTTKANGKASLSSPSTSSNGGGGGLKEAVDRALVADFFFILVALAWLVAGVAESSLVGTNNLLTPWYQLWPLVFQPALGLLMAGALVSGAVGWLASRDSADSK